MTTKQKIITNLWFDANAEEAVAFYLSVFEDARITAVARFSDAGPGPAGAVMAVAFELFGQTFVAINGGPMFGLSEAVSLFVDCATQDEIDRTWRLLGEGGTELACGWLKDRFGLCWQVNSSEVPAMLQDPDAARATRVMRAMMAMKKIDLEALRAAFRGD